MNVLNLMTASDEELLRHTYNTAFRRTGLEIELAHRLEHSLDALAQPPQCLEAIYKLGGSP